MKLNGKTINAPKPQRITVWRVPEPIHFMVQAVLDDSEFKELCPEPNAPVRKNIKTGVTTEMRDDPGYRKKVQEYGMQKVNWLTFKSLAATEGLEFETVDPNDPGTWANVRTELEEVFTQSEVADIINGVMVVNAPSEENYKEALENFTRMQQEGSASSFLQAEQEPSTSGEPASD